MACALGSQYAANRKTRRRHHGAEARQINSALMPEVSSDSTAYLDRKRGAARRKAQARPLRDDKNVRPASRHAATPTTQMATPRKTLGSRTASVAQGARGGQTAAERATGRTGPTQGQASTDERSPRSEGPKTKTTYEHSQEDETRTTRAKMARARTHTLLLPAVTKLKGERSNPKQ